jgi:hypothetical protein
LVYLYNIGVVKATEVQIKTGLFRGRADAILFNDGKLAVLEIKSVNKGEFGKLKKFASWQAYAQLQMYLHCLNIEDGIILVECKDDQRLKEFHIRRKPRIAREQIRQFAKLKTKLVEAGVMSR